MDEHRNRDVKEFLRSSYSIQKNNFVTDGPFEGVPVSQEYIDKMRTLEEKYSDIMWLPLDIPKIEFDNYEEFLKIWDEQSHKVVRVKPDAAEPWTKEDHPWGEKSSWNVAQFNGLTLYRHPGIPWEDTTFAAQPYVGEIPMFERIVKQVFDYFPIHTMITIFIWESKMPIGPHRDRGAYWKCPTEFRVMLHDENEEPTLYVADEFNDDPVYIDLPEDTNSFCWSNGKCMHGSTFHGKRKFILCIAGIQHSEKSDELFNRSIEKYKDKLNYPFKYDKK
jgi:hypothetical protein